MGKIAAIYINSPLVQMHKCRTPCYILTLVYCSRIVEIRDVNVAMAMLLRHEGKR